jgi:hypothetical protein
MLSVHGSGNGKSFGKMSIKKRKIDNMSFYLWLQVFLALQLLSCKAQNVNLPKENEHINQDTIMETFNIKQFNEKKDIGQNYIFFLDDGSKITQFGNSESGYYEYKTIPESINLLEYKEFYPSGHLKAKGIIYENKFSKGVWQYYDENGNITKTIDFDKPFTYSWEDILEYCEKNEINLKLSSTFILRRNDSTLWEISWILDLTKRKTVKIDGKSGVIIEERIVNLEDLRH